MPFLTLTTDWGTRDHYAGSLKGLLYSLIPDLVIVDITHQVPQHNIQQAAYIFSNTYGSYPGGTLHIIGVSLPASKPELLAVRKNGHLFIGSNDGIFSLIFGETPEEIVAVKQERITSCGYDLELLAGVSFQLLSGKQFNTLGQPPLEFIERSVFRPALDEEVIRGTIIYVDDHGNAVTNITRSLFEEQRRGRKFEIVTRRHGQQFGLDRISSYYSEEEPGGMLALFNESNLLEIAINQGSASGLLGLKLHDNIRIEFK